MSTLKSIRTEEENSATMSQTLRYGMQTISLDTSEKELIREPNTDIINILKR